MLHSAHRLIKKIFGLKNDFDHISVLWVNMTQLKKQRDISKLKIGFFATQVFYQGEIVW